MKIREALDQGLLRLVPMKPNGSWYAPYKGKPIESYKKHKGEIMALLNSGGRFAFVKNGENFSDITYVSLKKVAILNVDTDDQQNYDTRANSWTQVRVTGAFLESKIANTSDTDVQKNLLFFNDIISRAIQGKKLNEIELVSLLEDPDTYKILCKETLLHLYGVQGGDLAEIVRANVNPSFDAAGDRGRLLVWERAHGVKKPIALQLFDNQLLNKAVELKK